MTPKAQVTETKRQMSLQQALKVHIKGNNQQSEKKQEKDMQAVSVVRS